MALEEDLDAQKVLKEAADAEESAEDEDILNMCATTEEKAISAKSVSRTAADSEEETAGDEMLAGNEMLAAVFGEPEKKKRKGRK